jgi:membrane protease YdiL (CAAX protease family)
MFFIYSYLSRTLIGRDLGVDFYGVILGSILAISLVISSLGTLFLVNAIKIKKEVNPSKFYDLVMFFFTTALFEEIVFRGILFVGLRMIFPFEIALIITSILFLAPHLFNKGITIKSVSSVLLGSILLTTLFEITNSIFAPFAFHFIWNFLQGTFGLDVSGGKELSGIFKIELSGNDFITGGIFGFEASIITLIYLVIIDVILLIFL